MNKTLEKTIVGATAPTNKNVLWIDSKNNQIKYNNNNKWLRTSNHSDDTLDVFLPRTGGTMKGNIDMNGKRIDNIGIEEVNSLPTTNLYEGRMVKFKNKTYTFYNGLWLALSDDLRGHTNDTHEENFVYQPTAADLSIKDGFADIKKLKGNTVVWNQLSIPTKWSAGGGATSTYDTNTGVHTLTTLNLQHNRDLRINKTFAANHKFLIKCIIKSNYDGYCNIRFYPTTAISQVSLTNGIKTHIKILISTPEDAQTSLRLAVNDNTDEAGKTLEFENIQLIDLTQMFGEGNEPTIEEFEAMFPNEYYEYNEGELMSFDGKGVKSVGFNLFDKSKVLFKVYINAQGQVVNANIGLPDNAVNGVSDWIKVFPNTNYFVKNIIGNSMRCAVYDAEKNYITSLSNTVTHTDGNIGLCSKKITTPNNARYIRFGVSDKHIDSICINLSHSGYRDGEYQPYEDYTLSFQDGKSISQLTGKLNGGGDSVIIFPDGLRSAGEAFDEIVYDEATGKHYAYKRIGSVDMGTLGYIYNDGSSSPDKYPYGYFEIYKINNRLKRGKILCVKYPTLKGEVFNKDKVLVSSGAIYIIDSSYTDAASLKQSLQGQILYYELAEPEVYELDYPITTSYEAYDFGTEEVLYNDDKEVNIPMKANIEYGFNAVDMIRNNFEEIGKLKGEIETLKQRVEALEQTIQLMQSNNTQE